MPALCPGWDLMGEETDMTTPQHGGQPCDKAGAGGSGPGKEQSIHQAGRTVEAGVGGSQSHREGGAPETLESGQSQGTGEQSLAETYRAPSALTAPPHIASQKTQQEQARSGFSRRAGTLVSAQ